MSKIKEPTFLEIVNKLEKAFPEYDFNWLIHKIARLDKLQRTPSRSGWNKPIWEKANISGDAK